MASVLRSFNLGAAIRNVQIQYKSKGTPISQTFHNVLKNNSFVENCRSLSVLHQSQRHEIRNFPNKNLSQIITDIEENVRRYGRVETFQFRDALRTFSRQSGVTSNDAIFLLRCCGELMPQELPATRKEFADTIWDQIVSKGWSLDMSHFNSLLKVYLENEFDFSPMEFLSMLEEKGIEPNRVTFQRLIQRFCQQGDIAAATKILEHMKEKGEHINENVFYALMQGYSRAGDLASANNMLDMMKESGLPLTADTYLALAIAQAERGDIDRVLATIHAASEQDQQLDDQDHLDIIYSFASKGHSQHVPEILSRAKKSVGYNQDCKNTIYKLLNAGCDEAALAVFQSMTPVMERKDVPGPISSSGVFYLRHLIKQKRPVPTILDFIDKVSPNLKAAALLAAIETKSPLVYSLMAELQSNYDFPLRPHYFWPIIKNEAKSGNPQNVYGVLRKMLDLQVPVTVVTLCDYVLPSLSKLIESEDTIITELRKIGLNFSGCVNGLVRCHLENSQIKDASETLMRYPTRILSSSINSLIAASINSTDYDAAAIILGQMTLPRAAVEEESSATGESSETGEDSENTDEIMFNDEGERLMSQLIIRFASSRSGGNLQQMLEAIERRGLGISQHAAEAIAQKISHHLTPGSSAVLERLWSSGLERQPLPRRPRSGQKRLNLAELEKMYERRQSQDLMVDKLQVNLLSLYTKGRKTEKAEAIYQDIIKGGTVAIGDQVNMLSLYTYERDEEKALAMYRSIREAHPTTTIIKSKVLKLGGMLYSKGRVQDCLDIIKAEGAIDAPDAEAVGEEEEADSALTGQASDRKDYTEVIAASLLDIPASAGDAEGYEALEKALFDGFVEVTPKLQASKINLHLAKGDVDAAFEMMKEMFEKYNIIPLKNSLIKAFIRNDDPAKLEEIWKYSSTLHGRANSLLDLAFAFIEEKRLPQARNILETPGLKFQSGRLIYWCNGCRERNQTEFIEDFLKVSGGLLTSDRRLLCHQLLEAYISSNEPRKGLELWTNMQEQDITPSDEFQVRLGTFLRHNDMEVPFEVPELVIESSLEPSASSKPLASKQLAQTLSDNVMKFRALLAKKDVDGASAVYRESLGSSDKINTKDSMNLVSQLLDNDRLKDAVSLVKETPTFTGTSFANLVVLRRMMKTLATEGEIDTIKDFINAAPVTEKNVFLMDLSRAAVTHGQTEECFDFINSLVREHGDKINLSSVSSAFTYILHNDSSFAHKVEETATTPDMRKVANSVSWVRNIFSGDMSQADENLQEMKENAVPLPIASFLLMSRETKDLSKMPNIVEVVDKYPYQRGMNTKGNTYSCWIDVLVSQNKTEEAMLVLQSALKALELSNINRGTLHKLSDAAQEAKIDFPYQLPNTRRNRRRQASSSSSDSD